MLRETPFDLAPGQRLPRADVDLLQPFDRDRGEPVGLRDCLRRLERPLQRARVNRGEVFTSERRCQLCGLLPPELVQRRIGVALEAALAVPVRLPMARQQDLGHGGLG